MAEYFFDLSKKDQREALEYRRAETRRPRPPVIADRTVGQQPSRATSLTFSSRGTRKAKSSTTRQRPRGIWKSSLTVRLGSHWPRITQLCWRIK